MAVTQGNNSEAAYNASSFNHSHTVAAGSDFLIVALCKGTKGTLTTSVTYAGTAMKHLTAYINSGSSTDHPDIWFLHNPSTGANNVSVTFGSSDEVAVLCMDFGGVGSHVPYFVNNPSSSPRTSVSTTINSTTDGAVLWDVLNFNDASVTVDPDAGQTQKGSDTYTASDTGGAHSVKDATGGNDTMGWTVTNTGDVLEHTVVEIAPPGARPYAADHTTYDAGGSTSTAHPFIHTVYTYTDALLVIAVSDTDGTVSGATWNGTSMTQIFNQANNNPGVDHDFTAWILDSPESGVYNVEITYGSSVNCVAFAINLYYVDTSDVTNNSFKEENITTSTYDLTLSGLSAGDLCIGAVAYVAGPDDDVVRPSDEEYYFDDYYMEEGSNDLQLAVSTRVHDAASFTTQWYPNDNDNPYSQGVIAIAGAPDVADGGPPALAFMPPL